MGNEIAASLHQLKPLKTYNYEKAKNFPCISAAAA
jgi:hypothetical protein